MCLKQRKLFYRTIKSIDMITKNTLMLYLLLFFLTVTSAKTIADSYTDFTKYHLDQNHTG